MNRLLVGFSIIAVAFVMVLGVGSFNNVQAEGCGLCGIHLPSLCGWCNRTEAPPVARDTDVAVQSTPCGFCNWHMPNLCGFSLCNIRLPSLCCNRTEVRDMDVKVADTSTPCGFCNWHLPNLCFSCRN